MNRWWKYQRLSVGGRDFLNLLFDCLVQYMNELNMAACDPRRKGGRRVQMDFWTEQNKTKKLWLKFWPSLGFVYIRNRHAKGFFT